MSQQIKDPWEEWREKAEAKQRDARKQLEETEREFVRNLPEGTHPITDLEKEWLELLHGCRFYPGGWDKRFVHSLVWCDSSAGPAYQRKLFTVSELTVTQSYWIGKLIYKYRKQLHLTAEAAKQIQEKLISTIAKN